MATIVFRICGQRAEQKIREIVTFQFFPEIPTRSFIPRTRNWRSVIFCRSGYKFPQDPQRCPAVFIISPSAISRIRIFAVRAHSYSRAAVAALPVPDFSNTLERKICTRVNVSSATDLSAVYKCAHEGVFFYVADTYWSIGSASPQSFTQNFGPCILIAEIRMHTSPTTEAT